MAICIGLDLGLSVSEDLLKLCGYAFGASKEHQAYKFLLTALRGSGIDACNDVLIQLGFEPLGSKSKH
jgi:hypothetical protein